MTSSLPALARTFVPFLALAGAPGVGAAQDFGTEGALTGHLAPGEEVALPLPELLEHGRRVFATKFTRVDGHGRPGSKGDLGPLSDPNDPLVFPRNMNRISSPEASSCAGCHMDPRPGGSGEFLTNAFVLAERFDHATFDPSDPLPTKGAKDESGAAVVLDTIGNLRSTPHLFGSGYVEMIARQMTADLVALRDSLAPGGTVELRSKGVSFGTLARAPDGAFDVSAVYGLSSTSIATTGANDPPNLVVRAFSHGGATVSLRHFTNTAFHHHLGVQSEERVGTGVDLDGDGVVNELTRGDVTAATIFQATLPPPGRILPASKAAQNAIRYGEELFVAIGCAECHVPCLPLDPDGFEFSEPSPLNGIGNLRQGDAYHAQFGSVLVDLRSKQLPKPRLAPNAEGVIEVFAFSDFRIHDLSDGPDDPNREALDMHALPGTPQFFSGNGAFLTARLWGVGSSGPYFHHGKFTTLAEAVAAHGGEAAATRAAWFALEDVQRRSILEFLKSLRVLPEYAKHGFLDAKGKKVKDWPKFPWECGQAVDGPPR